MGKSKTAANERPAIAAKAIPLSFVEAVLSAAIACPIGRSSLVWLHQRQFKTERAAFFIDAVEHHFAAVPLDDRFDEMET
jgi:hypothetical protein